MKIVGINIEAAGGHSLVSVTAMFVQGEQLEEADVARMLDLAREAAGADKVSRATALLAAREVDDAEGNVVKSVTGRRRHQNPLGDGETGEKLDPTEAAPQGRRRRVAAPAEAEPEKPATDPAPAAETGRRRRSSAAEPAETPPAPASPSEGGRRRRRGAEQEPEQNPTPAPDAGSSRRRRGEASSTKENTGAKTTSPTEDDDKITDVDLMRACSQAAEKIGATLVKELLAGDPYECSSAKEMYDAHRPKFLKALAALVKKES